MAEDRKSVRRLDVVERLRRQLLPLAQKPIRPEAWPELSPERQERLRSLGYLQ